MASLWYVAGAYGVIWIVLFVYLVSIHQRLVSLHDQLEVARRRSEPPARGIPAKAAAPEHVAS